MTTPRLLTATAVMLLTGSLATWGQNRTHVHLRAQSEHWDIPFVTDSIDAIGIDGATRSLQLRLRSGAAVPFAADRLDSLHFADEPTAETKDHYQVFTLYITTDDGSDVTSKDYYTPCHVSLNARGAFTSYSAGAQMRCRGNSTLLWYPKKPYRLKLDQKHKVLGLGKARSWVLLANYRDVTDLMNTFVFEAGRWLGLPCTNHTRYAEVFVNGDYRGLYQLTEQVQQHSQRVDVSKERGILIALDVDDGPGAQPFAADNFTSAVFGLPVSVKFPDDELMTPHTVDSVRTVFARLERAVSSGDYQQAKQLLDIPSMIDFLLLQELVYNVELSAPRSVYMHKDGDGPWVMGPLWDFDAGYDFDWSNMYSGHDFFADYHETVMGTNPLRRNGNYPDVSPLFTSLFGSREFVGQYKARWAAVKDSLVSHAWEECLRYVGPLRASGALSREAQRWPLRGKDFDTELDRMHQWLLNRSAYMTRLVEGIPTPPR